MGLEPLEEKWCSFGWHVEKVDGHSIPDLLEKLQAVQKVQGKPQIIIANTIKGKGVSFVEADFTFHGRALTAEQAKKAREELLCN
jgi:transketolase